MQAYFPPQYMGIQVENVRYCAEIWWFCPLRPSGLRSLQFLPRAFLPPGERFVPHGTRSRARRFPRPADTLVSSITHPNCFLNHLERFSAGFLTFCGEKVKRPHDSGLKQTIWNGFRFFRVAAPSIRIVPWAALASCWPLPQQLLPVSAAGGGRRRC